MEPDSSRSVYDGKLIRVVVERWGDREREIVEPPHSVAIVAVDEEGCVALVRQVREAARRELLELPAGGVEEGEKALETAKRELAEETGLTGGTWRHWGGFFTTPGFCREWMDLYFAEGVQRGEASPTSDEQFEHVRVPVDELRDLLPTIEDAKTLTGIALYLREREL